MMSVSVKHFLSPNLKIDMIYYQIWRHFYKLGKNLMLILLFIESKLFKYEPPFFYIFLHIIRLIKWYNVMVFLKCQSFLHCTKPLLLLLYCTVILTVTTLLVFILLKLLYYLKRIYNLY